jgi:hypothetical protein
VNDPINDDEHMIRPRWSDEAEERGEREHDRRADETIKEPMQNNEAERGEK